MLQNYWKSVKKKMSKKLKDFKKKLSLYRMNYVNLRVKIHKDYRKFNLQ